MKYNPITAVWEITMGCNMRCKHCGSNCQNSLGDELTTEEALKLCDDLGEMGFKWITLSGGEPTTRDDWDLIAKRLKFNGIIPNMITNAWLIDEDIVERTVKSGINTIGVSVDGLKKTHDNIRKEGSFDRIIDTIDFFKNTPVNVSPITTLNNININELHDLKSIFKSKGIKTWQLQIGIPMGNMLKNKELVLEPEYIDKIIEFAYNTITDDSMYIQLAHGIGYFNKKEIEVRKNFGKVNGNHWRWRGCDAGKNLLGILHNGDITGCVSIRDRRFIEGNIRDTPIKEIWNSTSSFSWNREFSKEKLKGLCGKCNFGNLCLGGCTNHRLMFGKEIFCENKYCSYNLAIGKAKEVLSEIQEPAVLLSKAKKFIDNGSYQLAEILVTKLIEIDKDDVNALNLYGYISYMLGNYNDSKNANEKVLKIDIDNVYANMGLGMSLAKLGQVDMGLYFLNKAVSLTNDDFMDPYYDLAVVLNENGKKKEAIAILDEGRKKSEGFVEKSNKLYMQLKDDIEYSII